MTTHPQIRRRPDGSIDTAFYLEQGRQARSGAARSQPAPRLSARAHRPAPMPRLASMFGAFLA